MRPETGAFQSSLSLHQQTWLKQEASSSVAWKALNVALRALSAITMLLRASTNLNHVRVRRSFKNFLKTIFRKRPIVNGASRDHHHIRWCGSSVSCQAADTTAGQDGKPRCRVAPFFVGAKRWRTLNLR
jgi:hypothetical protein